MYTNVIPMQHRFRTGAQRNPGITVYHLVHSLD
jgi:hypothetical protein